MKLHKCTCLLSAENAFLGSNCRSSPSGVLSVTQKLTKTQFLYTWYTDCHHSDPSTVGQRRRRTTGQSHKDCDDSQAKQTAIQPWSKRRMQLTVGTQPQLILLQHEPYLRLREKSQKRKKDGKSQRGMLS